MLYNSSVICITNYINIITVFSSKKRENLMPIFIFIITFLSVSYSHAHEVSSCLCDDACYTDEVSNLKCNSRSASFRANGFPDESHILMHGIIATNQQFPRLHQYEYNITRTPKKAEKPTSVDAGAIGVAVNGVPIFDPATQGPVNPETGKRPSTLTAGELDKCGGHAGRGDDYHYHIAPICLIEELGIVHVEQKKRPIGYAMDGYPIHALGWFNKANDIEAQLDECRGMEDEKGAYFYNVKSDNSWDVITCLTGQPQKFSKDRWSYRKDKYGDEYVGMPLKFKIDTYTRTIHDTDICHVMSGILEKEQILLTDGSTQHMKNQVGSIFYCNPGCYGVFMEAEKTQSIRGRAILYDQILDKCPTTFTETTLFDIPVYTGPRQQVNQKVK